MQSFQMPFDLSLAYPQWQGSGRHENLPRGAAAAAAVCGQYAPQVRVPMGDNHADDAHGVRRWEAIFAQFRSAQDVLARSGASRVLTAGGDCAVDVAVIDYLNGIHPGLRVIWVDAHLDANTPATSPSGNFHGMPVSAILGRAPERGSAKQPSVDEAGRHLGRSVNARIRPGYRRTGMVSKNTICLWYDGTALDAAKFYAETFPDSVVGAALRAPGDYPAGKQGDVLTVEFTVMGIPCLGLNGGAAFKHNEAFSFQVATDDQAETDRLWNAIVGNDGQESACGWCKDKWGLSWQITPRALTAAITDPDPAAAKRAFDAMMEMTKIDIAAIEAARRG